MFSSSVFNFPKFSSDIPTFVPKLSTAVLKSLKPFAISVPYPDTSLASPTSFSVAFIPIYTPTNAALSPNNAFANPLVAAATLPPAKEVPKVVIAPAILISFVAKSADIFTANNMPKAYPTCFINSGSVPSRASAK